MKWFADNSELNGIRETTIPDILIFGGIAVPAEEEKELQVAIETIKEKYGHSRLPVKWNMRDLSKLYEKHEKTEMYNGLLSSSREWRHEMFSALAKFDFKIILSCIESYSEDRKIINKSKAGLIRYIFGNGLMRFGLHVQESQVAFPQIILDWPDAGNRTPFDTEYSYAYDRGETPDNVTYHCGPLKDLGFSDSVYYTNMNHSTLLQAADLVVGATREVIECCLGKREGGQGLECIKLVKNNYRGAPDNVVGRGLTVPTGNQEFRNCIVNGLNKLIFNGT